VHYVGHYTIYVWLSAVCHSGMSFIKIIVKVYLPWAQQSWTPDAVLNYLNWRHISESHLSNIDLMFSLCLGSIMGRASSVGIATRYWLEGPGIESSGGEIFHTRPDRSWNLPSLLSNGYGVSFPGVKLPSHCSVTMYCPVARNWFVLRVTVKHHHSPCVRLTDGRQACFLRGTKLTL
jgi:hypothetical protein